MTEQTNYEDKIVEILGLEKYYGYWSRLDMDEHGNILTSINFSEEVGQLKDLIAKVESETEKRVIERVKSEIKKERKSDKESMLWCDDVIFTYRRILDLPSLNPQPIKNNNN